MYLPRNIFIDKQSLNDFNPVVLCSGCYYFFYINHLIKCGEHLLTFLAYVDYSEGAELIDDVLDVRVPILLKVSSRESTDL
jgi:hypothetical protein